MTDITELAQRDKFEAWVMTQICISKSTLEACALLTDTDTTLSGTDYNRMWNCWKASGAELVEALEKAQQFTKERDEENESLMLTVGRLRTERESLENIRSAAERLVRCKGRYHSEQNYRALAALFGVNTPDLPPLESESRTVTVKLADYRATYTEPFALEIEHHVRKALKDVADAAGIQVIEGEGQ